MEIPHAAGHLAASGVGVAKAAHRHRSSVVGKINFAASLERKASYRLVSLVPKSYRIQELCGQVLCGDSSQVIGVFYRKLHLAVKAKLKLN